MALTQHLTRLNMYKMFLPIDLEFLLTLHKIQEIIKCSQLFQNMLENAPLRTSSEKRVSKSILEQKILKGIL